MKQRLTWNRGVPMASSVCHKIVIGLYDLPLFHATRCFTSPPFLCTYHSSTILLHSSTTCEIEYSRRSGSASALHFVLFYRCDFAAGGSLRHCSRIRCVDLCGWGSRRGALWPLRGRSRGTGRLHGEDGHYHRYTRYVSRQTQSTKDFETDKLRPCRCCWSLHTKVKNKIWKYVDFLLENNRVSECLKIRITLEVCKTIPLQTAYWIVILSWVNVAKRARTKSQTGRNYTGHNTASDNDTWPPMQARPAAFGPFYSKWANGLNGSIGPF